MPCIFDVDCNQLILRSEAILADLEYEIPNNGILTFYADNWISGWQASTRDVKENAECYTLLRFSSLNLPAVKASWLPFLIKAEI